MSAKFATPPSYNADQAAAPCARLKSIPYGSLSNTLSCLLLLSGFWTQSTNLILLEITVAAGLTFVTHAGLLLFSPPDKQYLSSFLLVVIAGPLSVWNGLTWLYMWEGGLRNSNSIM